MLFTKELKLLVPEREEWRKKILKNPVVFAQTSAVLDRVLLVCAG
jgi:hypothetical protein